MIVLIFWNLDIFTVFSPAFQGMNGSNQWCIAVLSLAFQGIRIVSIKVSKLIVQLCTHMMGIRYGSRICSPCGVYEELFVKWVEALCTYYIVAELRSRKFAALISS